MTDIWFTSDTHFTHRNIMKHYPARSRFGEDEEAMCEWMIDQWNDMIKPKDTVYHIGDFGGYDTDRDVKVAAKLNGRLHYLPGNHDRKIVKNEKFQRRCSVMYPYSYAEISVEGQKIVICHFPIWEWNQMNRGVWHLHGHVHGKPTGIPGKIKDVSADGHGLLPYHFDEIREFMDLHPVRHHHAPLDEL